MTTIEKTHSFDKDYWDQIWGGDRAVAMGSSQTNPHLIAEVSSLAPGTASGVAEQVTWVQADLSVWEPATRYDLVTTHYAHPAIPQLEFYARIASWVAPAGTLLIVGHLAHHGHGQTPASASVTATDVSARLDPALWEIVTAEESHDVVVRALRR